MLLNVIWAGLILCALLAALIQALWLGQAGVFAEMVKALFDASKTGFDIALGLTGVMCLWLGLMRVGERAGMVAWLARLGAPLLRLLFPGVPAGHPAQGAMTMNISANMLGLDNAATPLGLAAMRELQSLNREPAGTASDAQIMFVVLNTAGLTLIPTSVIAIRQSVALKQGLGSSFNAADIFLPTLLATLASLLAAVLLVGAIQRLPLWKPRFLLPFGLVGGLLALAVTALARLPAEQAARLAGMVPNPRYYDRNRSAPGLGRKAAIILGRMPGAEVP